MPCDLQRSIEACSSIAQRDSREPTSCHMLTIHQEAICSARAEVQKDSDSEGVFTRQLLAALARCMLPIE